jgi:hypothetical protein
MTVETQKISNEFATVEISVVNTSKGKRVKLRSPKLGHEILLDPLEIESLTWQDPGMFSELLSTPFGPEEGDVHMHGHDH